MKKYLVEEINLVAVQSRLKAVGFDDGEHPSALEVWVNSNQWIPLNKPSSGMRLTQEESKILQVPFFEMLENHWTNTFWLDLFSKMDRNNNLDIDRLDE